MEVRRPGLFCDLKFFQILAFLAVLNAGLKIVDRSGLSFAGEWDRASPSIQRAAHFVTIVENAALARRDTLEHLRTHGAVAGEWGEAVLGRLAPQNPQTLRALAGQDTFVVLRLVADARRALRGLQSWEERTFSDGYAGTLRSQRSQWMQTQYDPVSGTLMQLAEAFLQMDLHWEESQAASRVAASRGIGGTVAVCLVGGTAATGGLGTTVAGLIAGVGLWTGPAAGIAVSESLESSQQEGPAARLARFRGNSRYSSPGVLPPWAPQPESDRYRDGTVPQAPIQDQASVVSAGGVRATNSSGFPGERHRAESPGDGVVVRGRRASVGETSGPR